MRDKEHLPNFRDSRAIPKRLNTRDRKRGRVVGVRRFMESEFFFKKEKSGKTTDVEKRVFAS